MKKLKSQVTYKVPSWNFCNSDRLSMWGDVTKERCQFCIIKGREHICTLHSENLRTDSTAVGTPMIHKCEACCRATAGFKTEIIADDLPEPKKFPQINTKSIVTTAVETYEQYVNDLMTNQNLPYAMASKLAKKALLNSK